ncbi:MAG TPA: class I SAM-dependent methyltransferase [Candidatus Dormibacteraeota bacterium]|jgi:ubiquinone/menaquinone biosynthesis C-methylase UbiE|nr:class I SAM-dependent methyltransferase [Candidatus Dormibacteraeota bacterium]
MAAQHQHQHPSDRHGDFDTWAPQYDRSRLQRLVFDRVHSRVVDAVVPLVRGISAPVVVDVGCGTGRLLARLGAALPAASLIGIDASPGMIEVARAKPELHGMRLDVGSSEALPLDDAGCDVVVSTISFHHWSDQAAGLRDVGRVLRPGGHLLLVDFVPRGLLAPLVRRRFTDGHGSGSLGEGELLRLLGGTTLRAESLRRVGPPGSPLALVTAERV